MGLPNTLAGIVGLVIFVVFIIAISASDIFPDQTKTIKDSQDNYLNNFNKTINTTATNDNPGFWGTILGITGLDGIYNYVVNFFSMMISFLIMVGTYVLVFFGIAGTIPVEFYIFFALIGSGFIIAILKLIFLNGE